MLPDHTYAVVSGGDPLKIPDLSWEQLKHFHATHYHPSNARYWKERGKEEKFGPLIIIAQQLLCYSANDRTQDSKIALIFVFCYPFFLNVQPFWSNKIKSGSLLLIIAKSLELEDQQSRILRKDEDCLKSLAWKLIKFLFRETVINWDYLIARTWMTWMSYLKKCQYKDNKWLSFF